MTLHYDILDIELLEKNNMVISLSKIKRPTRLCEAYLNVYGPNTHASSVGNRYFLTFPNDYSGKKCLIILKSLKT